MAKSGKAKTGKGSKKTASARDILAKELIGLVKQIDEEGLAFLIKQAHVIIHNMQIERINQEMSKLQLMNSKVRQAGSKPKAPVSYPVDIEEGTGGKHFILVVAGKRKMFAREEMSKLVTICQAAPGERPAAQRLLNWFKTNRSDVLLDTGINNAGSPTLAAIYKIIKSRYKVRS
jgi:hypothetical protein